MLTVLSVVGTRPEVIKMAPVIAELKRYPDRVRALVCVTGQHREMLDQALEIFSLKPDYDLNLMHPDQSLSFLTARLIEALDEVVKQIRPDWIISQGDTTSVLAAAFTAFYHQIPFGHVEAGLRTENINSPFPEELNRRVADSMSTVWFAPTERARQILIHEGHPRNNIIVTGNTVVDALHQVIARGYNWASGPLASVPSDKRLVLVTIHRRENFGEPLQNICSALRHIAETLASEGVHLVCPVHPNPNVCTPIREMLSGLRNLSLLAPLDYISLVNLMRRSTLVLTDSGGIQEEAPSLGVPVLVMRETTERPEGIEAGVAKLVGTNYHDITTAAIRLLRDSSEYVKMVPSENPYGDGRASSRIVAAFFERVG
jgi:UDP-N-acetylglucosamine 2-epimerase (non-hydrolysing)